MPNWLYIATNAVYLIRRSDGDVRWKFGGTPTARSLTLEDDPDSGPAGQHDARFLPDGSVTIHDNRTGTGAPRAAQYRIDTKAGTATLVEQVTDPLIPFSLYSGGARKMPGGDWAISWGGARDVTELTPSGRRVFLLRFDAHGSYRVYPVMPGQVSRRALRRGMDAMSGRG